MEEVTREMEAEMIGLLPRLQRHIDQFLADTRH
jgi:hypothetical protein